MICVSPWHDGLLGLPDLLEIGVLLLELADLPLEVGETALRRFVGLLLQRLALDLELDQAPLEPVHLLGLRVHLHADPRRGLVDQVDRLVGQLAVADVAMRERRRGDDRGVRDLDVVMDRVALLQAAQDRDRVLDRRLVDEHLLEAALERRVLLDVLAVLVERRRADAVQLAARERGLQHVAGVHRAFGLAGADHRVQLVDEEDDLAFLLREVVQHGLQALLELAAELRARDQRAHVERQHALVLEPLGHLAVDDALREPFDDRGLADTGLADQHGVVLRAPLQHLNRAADLVVAADHGVELLLLRALGEVDRVFLERLARSLRRSDRRPCAPPRISSIAFSIAPFTAPAFSRIRPRSVFDCTAASRNSSLAMYASPRSCASLSVTFRSLPRSFEMCTSPGVPSTVGRRSSASPSCERRTIHVHAGLRERSLHGAALLLEQRRTSDEPAR